MASRNHRETGVVSPQNEHTDTFPNKEPEWKGLEELTEPRARLWAFLDEDTTPLLKGSSESQDTICPSNVETPELSDEDHQLLRPQDTTGNKSRKFATNSRTVP